MQSSIYGSDMKRLLDICLVGFFATTIFFGCSNNGAIEANKLVNRARESDQEDSRRDTEIDEELENLDHLLDSDLPDAQRLMKRATENAKTLDIQFKSIKKMIALLKEAKRLNLSDTY